MKNVPTPSLRSVSTTILLASLAFALVLAVSGQSLPTFSKSFDPGTIGPGSTSTLQFVISTDFPVRSVAFTDVLPAGMTIADPANPTSTCFGTISAPAGAGTISFSDADVASSCVITVDVTSSTPGTHTNTTSNLTWEDGGGVPGSSSPASGDLTVATDRPGFTKSFSPSGGSGNQRIADFRCSSK